MPNMNYYDLTQVCRESRTFIEAVIEAEVDIIE